MPPGTLKNVRARLAIVCAFVGVLQAQTPPAFEMVRVFPGADARGRSVRFLPDTFSVTWCPLAVIVTSVYGLRDFQVVDAPAWFSDPGYGLNIEAKAPGRADERQLKLMAQHLLADRFRLKVHRETREIPVYALAVGTGGPKGIAKVSAHPRDAGFVSTINGWLEGINISMPILAAAITVDRAVIDKTNFSGAIDFDLRYTGQSIFAVIEPQLGLVLRPETDPIEVLIIDQIEHPVAN
jgi:uncharacterized protein (TIGR03435 family)